MHPLKKALDKCKFIDQKKAEGAAKKAERAAAKAEAAVSTGEGISDLMHDGTCEKATDCPTDRPKCLNKQCMTNAAFVASKKAEGAAKKAERAAAKAEAAVSTGEGISDLMHDGTCEKATDCPTDRPKCLNKQCMTNAAFVASKKAEGAAKKAERAAAKAEAAVSTGEGISDLMHDGTCEKATDCPTDRPKCLNKQCMTNAAFVASKKAEGAAKKAERAAAKAEAAVSTGEGISDLMHDGTCEKATDCPTDRPKCLNKQCMTNAAFVASKKAEGAAKKAERAAAKAEAAVSTGEGITDLMHDGTCEKATDCPTDRPKCLNKQCMTNAAFVASKKAVGAAKKAERAAAKAEAAVSTGEGISDLMHDGTCEKATDCPTDRPKCLNKQCMTNAAFVASKKAEGAAKKAERAAAKAEAAVSTGEGISDLMHDGTCEKATDCPTDRPKCLNKQCMTNAAFVASKKAEGAAKKAERAAAKAEAAVSTGEGISDLMHDGTCEKATDCPTDRPKCLNKQCMTNAAFVASKKAEGAAKKAERAAAKAEAAVSTGEGISDLMHDGTCEKATDCPTDRPKCLNKQCMTNAAFVASKKAEGAAKKAERAAAKAEAAVSTGEGISDLMHDGICEKATDCPTDRPKCLNKQCMTNAAFVASKKAEGAAKKAERAAERAISIEEAKNVETPENMEEIFEQDYFDKYLKTFSDFIDNLPDNNKLKKYANV